MEHPPGIATGYGLKFDHLPWFSVLLPLLLLLLLFFYDNYYYDLLLVRVSPVKYHERYYFTVITIITLITIVLFTEIRVWCLGASRTAFLGCRVAYQQPAEHPNTLRLRIISIVFSALQGLPKSFSIISNRTLQDHESAVSGSESSQLPYIMAKNLIKHAGQRGVLRPLLQMPI